jgi:exocyst complex protein 7
MESHMLSGGGGDGEDEGGIGKVWFKEMIAGLIRKNRGAYVRSTFERLSSHLTDVDKTKFKYQTGGKLLTLECGRELKSRFGGFADDMEAIHKRHTHLSVPSYEVREALIREGVEIVKERYEWFWREYGDVQFSKKKQQEYMRISPVMVEAMIREFYSAAGETYLPGKVTLSAVTTSSF